MAAVTEETTADVNEEVTEEESQETVIPKGQDETSVMSDEALDRELEASLKEPEDTDEESDGNPDKEVTTNAEKEQKEDEVTDDETKDKVEEEVKDKQEVPATDIEKLQKQLKDKESFIGKQSTEIGAIKQLLAEVQTKVQRANANQPIDPELLEQFNEDFVSDPGTAVAKLTQKITAQNNELNQSKELGLQKEREAWKQRQQQRVEQNAAAIPNLSEISDKMSVLMKESGFFTDENIDTFKTNPGIADPLILKPYADLVNSNLKVSSLEEENAQLKAKIAQLPKDILKSFRKTPRTLNGKTPSSKVNTGLVSATDQDIANLTDEQVEQQLAASRKMDMERAA